MCLGLCSFIITKEWFATFTKMFGKLNSDYTPIFLPIMVKVQCTMLKQLNKTSLAGWLPFVQIWFYLAMDSLCLCQKKFMFPKRCLEH